MIYVAMECILNCEFMNFINKEFICTYYNKPLLHVWSPGKKIFIRRCKECEEEGIICINKTAEDIRKIKNYVSWMADSFYSHKDEFESNLTEIYRLLKQMEDYEKGRIR